MHCKKARKNISLAMDSRLDPAGRECLQAHLGVCPTCRNWQQEQYWFLYLIKTPQAPQQPSPGFHAALRNKINASHVQTKFLTFSSVSLRPAVLRAAMFMILIFSALFGFYLSGRLDAPAVNSTAAVFNQTMHLDAFADLPSESFGAVYERLLQGELQ